LKNPPKFVKSKQIKKKKGTVKMSFKSFLLKYAAEMETIGTALDIVSRVSVENKSDVAKVRDAGDVAKSAAKNIMETIDDVQEIAKMEIGRDEIIDILKELVPMAIGEFLTSAKEKAAAEMKKATPTKKKTPAKKETKS